MKTMQFAIEKQRGEVVQALIEESGFAYEPKDIDMARGEARAWHTNQHAALDSCRIGTQPSRGTRASRNVYYA